jgi:hypothetical protein
MVNGATKYREFNYMNKSKLLASTMLVSAAALMVAGGANAATLKLGGVAEFWVGVGDPNGKLDSATNQLNNFDVKNDSEIHFKAEETLDNGLKIGALLEMEAGNGNDNAGGTGFDETSGWVKAPWGQINLGNNDVASSYVGGVSAVGPVGVIKSDAGDWLNGFDARLNNVDADVGVGDAQNVTYFTPRVAGVQLIVSYTPDQTDTGGDGVYDDSETTGFNNAWSGAVKYGAKFGEVGIKLNAGMTHVKTAGGGVSADDSATRDAHNVKAEVSVGRATITGAYAKENLDSQNEFYYGAGVVFAVSKTDKVSAAWTYSEDADVQGTKDLGSSIYAFGYSRNLGKGISLAASAFYAEEEQATGGDQSGVGVVGGFVVKF